MSTDYSAACMTCRRETHLGQFMAGHWSFEWGSVDGAHYTGLAARGIWERAFGEWLMEHLDHEVRILQSESRPIEGFAEDDLFPKAGPAP